MKLPSDSTLRHSEQVGIRADVFCLSLWDDLNIADHGAVEMTSSIPWLRPTQHFLYG